MLQCYNRGCGQKFDPANNNDDSCRHHPGMPFFHDAYKGWTCCNKKSVDFTEFLNMKGCTLAKHSNVKPPEPEKVEKSCEYEEPNKEIPNPIKVSLDRPPFESPLTDLSPIVLPALKEAVDSLVPKTVKRSDFSSKSGEISVGTNCKNGGCIYKYTSPESEESECQYHPGVPIFHEGMKYWSCCNRKTSDFTVFVNQPGCTYGKHKWINGDGSKSVSCRYDWHQTPSNVIVAIYAKLYHYEKSKIKVNPIRLHVTLVFPDQNDAVFDLDLELRGIIKVDATTVRMYPTKIEITMPKAEAGSWPKLDFLRNVGSKRDKEDSKETTEKDLEYSGSDSEWDVDLDSIEPIKGTQITNID